MYVCYACIIKLPVQRLGLRLAVRMCEHVHVFVLWVMFHGFHNIFFPSVSGMTYSVADPERVRVGGVVGGRSIEPTFKSEVFDFYKEFEETICKSA